MEPLAVFEHFYGARSVEAGVRYWQQFGWEVEAEGRLPATLSDSRYGLERPLASARMRFPTANEHSRIRVVSWDPMPATPPLHPLAVGSRWSAMRTADVLQLADAYRDEAAATGLSCEVTEIARVPRDSAGHAPSFFAPFMGYRAIFVVREDARHCWLERSWKGGISDGDFADDSSLSGGPPTHADLVVSGQAGMGFYTDGLGLSGGDGRVVTPDLASRTLLGNPDGAIRYAIHGFGVEGSAAGNLNVYARLDADPSDRTAVNLGSLGPCCVSVSYPEGSLAQRIPAVAKAGGRIRGSGTNEFGEACATVLAPDGSIWSLVERAGR